MSIFAGVLGVVGLLLEFYLGGFGGCGGVFWEVFVCVCVVFWASFFLVVGLLFWFVGFFCVLFIYIYGVIYIYIYIPSRYVAALEASSRRHLIMVLKFSFWSVDIYLMQSAGAKK